VDDSELPWYRDYQRALYDHLARNDARWVELAAAGVDARTLLWLEFAFEAPGRREAQALAAAVGEATLDGAAEHAVRIEAAGLWPARRHRVLGETAACYVTRPVLDAWTDRLVREAARAGCRFLGWTARIP
jgi:hypothetical protein